MVVPLDSQWSDGDYSNHQAERAKRSEGASASAGSRPSDTVGGFWFFLSTLDPAAMSAFNLDTASQAVHFTHGGRWRLVAAGAIVAGCGAQLVAHQLSTGGGETILHSGGGEEASSPVTSNRAVGRERAC